jgi:hypothetical protein
MARVLDPLGVFAGGDTGGADALPAWRPVGGPCEGGAAKLFDGEGCWLLGEEAADFLGQWCVGVDGGLLAQLGFAVEAEVDGDVGGVSAGDRAGDEVCDSAPLAAEGEDGRSGDGFAKVVHRVLAIDGVADDQRCVFGDGGLDDGVDHGVEQGGVAAEDGGVPVASGCEAEGCARARAGGFDGVERVAGAYGAAAGAIRHQEDCGALLLHPTEQAQFMAGVAVQEQRPCAEAFRCRL